MLLVIDRSGQVHCLYSEAIELGQLGNLCIRRASYVEPDHKGQWHVDLSPVSGPTLGPYASRQCALDAEQAWLEANWLAEVAP